MARRQFDPYAPQKRPWELVAVVVLCVVQAVAEVVAGFLVILARIPAEFSSGGVTVVTLAGAFSVLIGLFIIGVASGIFRGDRVARIALTILLAFDLASDVYLAVTDGSQPTLWAGSIILSIVIIVIVWTGRPRRYFAYRGR